MSSTTIKLESKLLQGIRAVKPSAQSISSWVREVLEHEIQTKRMTEAAQRYKDFLAVNKDEVKEMKDWEAAPLDRSPRCRSRRKK